MFQIGYQNVDDWGTDFGNYSNTRPRIAFVTKAGPMIRGGNLREGLRERHRRRHAGACEQLADADNDTYALSGIYKAKGVEAGLLYKYLRYNSYRPVMAPEQTFNSAFALCEGDVRSGLCRGGNDVLVRQDAEYEAADSMFRCTRTSISRHGAPTSRGRSTSARPMSALCSPSPPATISPTEQRSRRRRAAAAPTMHPH